ncbi:hypothetical protein [Aquitalea aquatica]|uniref:Uncharacterized protein n=1 Tax=Aquitalea aquatica TaxID=3044273 RepID=A0A838YA71_9NEIS|nr:hypothetical protein [Aquitalea magnusonii]MBA4707935.1 hypothetical protein [Aquitalea magnusonii]
MSELSIKIEYENNRKKPAAVFEAMAQYIEAYQDFSQLLISSVGIKADFEFQLDDIKEGSILSKLSALPGLIDKGLEEIFYAAGNRTMAKLKGQTSTEEDVESLGAELEADIAKRISGEIASPMIDRTKLAFVLREFSQANEKLNKGEKVSFHSKDERSNIYHLDTDWRFTGNPAEMFQGDIEHHDVEGSFYAVMAVNEGNALWCFKSIEMNRRIHATITHKDWLSRYQNGLIQPIGPKDVIKARVAYDIYTPPKGRGNPTIRNAKIIDVIQIIRNQSGYQYEFGGNQ